MGQVLVGSYFQYLLHGISLISLIPGQDRAHLDQIWSAQTEPAIDLGQLDALHAFSNFLGPDLNAGPSQSSRKNPAGTRTRDRARARSRGRPS